MREAFEPLVPEVLGRLHATRLKSCSSIRQPEDHIRRAYIHYDHLQRDGPFGSALSPRSIASVSNSRV
jgi:hypothetical protein